MSDLEKLGEELCLLFGMVIMCMGFTDLAVLHEGGGVVDGVLLGMGVILIARGVGLGRGTAR